MREHYNVLYSIMFSIMLRHDDVLWKSIVLCPSLSQRIIQYYLPEYIQVVLYLSNMSSHYIVVGMSKVL